MAQRYGVTPSMLAYQEVPHLNLDIFVFRKAIEKEMSDLKKQQIMNKMGAGSRPKTTSPRKHIPKVRY